MTERMPYYHLSSKFRPVTETARAKTQTALSEHLAQNRPRAKLGWPLLDTDKSTVGWMIIIEADDHEQAKAYLTHSPLRHGRAVRHNRSVRADGRSRTTWMTKAMVARAPRKDWPPMPAGSNLGGIAS